jgi:ribulose-phosphate 3-epimerase
MAALIPAILPGTRAELDAKLLHLHGVTRDVQIDIVDGQFASPATWPYRVDGSGTKPEVGPLAEVGSFKYEVDLMVRNPERIIGSWIEAGASRITVHAQSTSRLGDVIKEFEVTYGHDKGFMPNLLSLGLAVSIETDTALIEPYLDHCDYVQFMGIASIGKQGQKFDPRVLPKISAFHRAYPDMLIQVDGGVSVETAPKLLEAGASSLVIGSTLWGAPDVATRFAELRELTQQYGLYT